jgi:hypothetical protein
MTTDPSKELPENMPEGDIPLKKEEEVVNQADAVDIKGEDKTDTIVTQQEQTPKDDCSDLTDNNNDGEEQIPRSFPQKVSVCCNNELDVWYVSCIVWHVSAMVACDGLYDGLGAVVRHQRRS